MQGFVDHLLDHRSRERFAPWRARGVPEKSLHAGLGIAAAPAPDGQDARADAGGDLGGAQTFARQQNDSSPPDHLLGCVAVADQLLQALSISGWNLNAFDLTHASRVARLVRLR